MVKTVFLLAALCMLQVSFAARLVREAPATPLEDLSKQTSDFLSTLGTQFNSMISAKDTEELGDIWRNNTNTFISQVQDLAKNLQEKLGSTTGDVSNVVQDVVSKLNQTVADLQAQNPEATARAKEFQEKLQEGFKTVVSEADKVAKTLGDNSKPLQEDLAKLTKKAYDQVLATAQQVQQQVSEAANKA